MQRTTVRMQLGRSIVAIVTGCNRDACFGSGMTLARFCRSVSCRSVADAGTAQTVERLPQLTSNPRPETDLVVRRHQSASEVNGAASTAESF